MTTIGGIVAVQVYLSGLRGTVPIDPKWPKADIRIESKPLVPQAYLIIATNDQEKKKVRAKGDHSAQTEIQWNTHSKESLVGRSGMAYRDRDSRIRRV